MLLLGNPSLHAAKPNQLNQLTPEQIADGWISLFDGETLFGWTPTSDANWKVEDGAITVSDGEQGFLMTTTEFGAYELHVEFKAPESTNSGLFLKTPLRPTNPRSDCYEVNIAPADNPFPTGSLVERRRYPELAETTKNNQNVTLEQTESASAAPSDDWRSFDIVIDYGSYPITVDLDGKQLYQYIEKTTIRGRVGLQFREGPVAFRNIRLRPLGLRPMLNGKDLAGWNTANVENSKFEVADNGELHVTDGRGILETDASYGDFIMQLDAYVDGDNLNSGVFFRSIPREYANGYESQIHNAYKDDDSTRPTDFGTGAIYRRVAARRVVSKDREWFTKTIVATGPHIAVWVNGYQTTDWTDERPEHENPRSGLRTKPGTISLQGHDPTTNLRFRNLRIVELPEANPIAN